MSILIDHPATKASRIAVPKKVQQPNWWAVLKNAIFGKVNPKKKLKNPLDYQEYLIMGVPESKGNAEK